MFDARNEESGTEVRMSGARERKASSQKESMETRDTHAHTTHGRARLNGVGLRKV